LSLKPFNHPTQRIPQKVLTSSRKVEECAPLEDGDATLVPQEELIRRRLARMKELQALYKAGAHTRPHFGST